MTRADAWIHFAAAALVEAGENIAHAGEIADAMLEEFVDRFEPVPYGEGQAPLGNAPDTFQARKDV